MIKLSNPLGKRELIVTCPFGAWYKWGKHKGVDFRTRNEDHPNGVGTEVYMAHDGELIEVWYSDSLEWCYRFKLKNGYELLYYHLSRINHKEGWKKRRRGDLIGFSGGLAGTGKATSGPHLHFELRKDGVQIDAMLGIRETQKFIDRVENMRFIDVDNKGKFYLVHNGEKYYAQNGEDCFNIMRKLSTGITGEDINIIPDGKLE